MPNKLNKTQTSVFFTNPETGYSQVRALWSKLVREKTPLTATDYLFYLVIMGKDVSKAFNPVTNKVKLENGQFDYNTYVVTLGRVRSSLYQHFFGNLLVLEINTLVFNKLDRMKPIYV